MSIINFEKTIKTGQYTGAARLHLLPFFDKHGGEFRFAVTRLEADAFD
jgi:hypothetical protein